MVSTLSKYHVGPQLRFRRTWASFSRRWYFDRLLFVVRRLTFVFCGCFYQGPRVKLLNSTRQLYTSDSQEFSAGPPGPSPSTRPVGHTPGWSPQGLIATSSPPTTVAAGVPYGAKRVPGRKVDTNKRVSKSLKFVFDFKNESVTISSYCITRR